MLSIWNLINNQIITVGQVDRLGVPLGTTILTQDYIQAAPVIPIFRTCHGFGDWGILSAMPRLIKQKYPDKQVLIPSPELIHKMFTHLIDNLKWWSSWKEPWMNARAVFKNNPYIDGEFDSFEGEVLCDHYQLYSTETLHDPLAKRMLRVWGFSEDELQDVRPELYFDDQEIAVGDSLIDQYLGQDYISLILSNRHKPGDRDSQILEIIKQHPYRCLYYSSTPLETTSYKTHLIDPVNILDITSDIRIQTYIRSKAKLNIGTQTGVMDVLVRYTPVYTVPHDTYETFLHGNYIQSTNYII